MQQELGGEMRLKSKHRRHSRIILLTVIFGLIGSMVTACSGGSTKADAELVSSDSLTYLTAASFPPFEYKNEEGLTGFDIDMINGLAEIIGLTTVPMDLDFDGLIPALQGGRGDLINSAMYIKPERSAQVDFIPYMVVGEAILVPKGNPKGITEVPLGLSGKTVAVTRGAIGETYMIKFNEELKAAGLPLMKIMALPNNQDALLAVRSGRADAFDTSIPGGAFTITETNGEFEVAATFDLGTQIGMAVRKGDAKMKKLIEDALSEFVSSGKYEELLVKYNLPSSVNLFAPTK